MGARIILGLLFVVFGLNGFLNFIPMPPPPENMMKFAMALMETGFFMQL
jgi:putative oxidoreductase